MSILASIFGSSRSANTRRGQDMLAGAANEGTSLFRRLEERNAQNEAQGIYDIEKIIDSALKRSMRDLQVGTNNQLATRLGQGFRQGDSVLSTDAQQLSERARLGLAEQMAQAQVGADERRNRDFNQMIGMGFNNASLQSGIGSQFANIGAQEDARNQGLIGGAFQTLGQLGVFNPRKKTTP